MRTKSVLILIAAVAAAGCGSDVPDYPDTAPVTGTVTRGGQPVDGAIVTFIPPQQPPQGERAYPATATTGPDGKYSLSTFFSPAVTGEGAVPGTYQVTVTKAPPVDPNAGEAHGDDASQGAAAKGPTNLLPKQYASASTTPLEATVEAGKDNDIPLELK